MARPMQPLKAPRTLHPATAQVAVTARTSEGITTHLLTLDRLTNPWAAERDPATLRSMRGLASLAQPPLTSTDIEVAVAKACVLRALREVESQRRTAAELRVGPEVMAPSYARGKRCGGCACWQRVVGCRWE